MNNNVGSKTHGKFRKVWLAMPGVALSLTLTSVVNGQVAALPPIPLTQSTQLGQGYAVGVGSMRAQALALPEITSSESNRVEYDLQYVDDYSELARVLKISAAASYGAGGVGGNARANLMRSSTLSRRNAYVVVRALVEIRTDSISSYPLNANAVAAAGSSPEAFFQGYGDSFVRSISYGGELAALMEFATTSAAESQQLRIDVKAAAGGFAGAGSYDEAIRTLSQGRRVTVRYAQTGGDTGQLLALLAIGQMPTRNVVDSKGGAVVLTPEQLIRRLGEFLPEVRNFPSQAKALSGELSDYGAVSGWPAAVPKPIPAPNNGRLSAAVATLRLLEEELATVNDGMSTNDYQNAAALNEGLILRSYLDYVRQLADTAVRQIAATPQDKSNWVIPTRDQYSDEVMLSMPSNVWRGNAGDQCSVLEQDLSRLRTCLLGQKGGWTFERWPRVKSFRVERAVSGEFMKVRENLIVQPGMSLNWAGSIHHSLPTPINVFADQLCGKTGPDDGRLALWSVVSETSFGGNCCGYSASNFACVEFEKPAEAVYPRPVYTQKEGASRVGTVRTVMQAGEQYIEFDVKPPCAKGVGAYLITQPVSEGFPKKDRGYYRFSNDGLQTVRHPISNGAGTDDAETPAIILETAYCAA